MSVDRIRKLASYVERAAWVQVFFGLLTQMSPDFAFPSYNALLGFWGVYAALNRHGRATFGYVSFGILSVFLDIVYCSIYGGVGRSASFRFALAMFVFCLLAKLLSLYYASYLFAAMGGAQSLDLSPVPSGSPSRSRRGQAAKGGAGAGRLDADAMERGSQLLQEEEGDDDEYAGAGGDSVYDSFMRSVAPGPRRVTTPSSSLPAASSAFSAASPLSSSYPLPQPPAPRGRAAPSATVASTLVAENGEDGSSSSGYDPYGSALSGPAARRGGPSPYASSMSMSRYAQPQVLSQARGDLPEYVDDRF